jgi:predicted Zn-ribbon and HTH transcriptional regulator
MKPIFKDDMTPEMLQELFTNDDKCLEFLATVKWANGFECRKCGNTNSCPGKVPHSRRCTRCKNEESATANTLFHNCKFEISKAFFIAYNVCKGETDLSSYELASKLSLRQMTCWKFKHKIQQTINGMNMLNTEEKVTMQELLVGKDKFKDKFNIL